jgi:hypothetical protein
MAFNERRLAIVGPAYAPNLDASARPIDADVS